MIKIKQCTCVNVGQDKLHGKGNRVFNKTAKDKPVIWRCTVCNKTTE